MAEVMMEQSFAEWSNSAPDYFTFCVQVAENGFSLTITDRGGTSIYIARNRNELCTLITTYVNNAPSEGVGDVK